jgi:RNA polymerase sigma-70 factor (ECF subfamily)
MADADVRPAQLRDLLVHGPTLLAAARLITLDDAEAQDLVQTTYEIAIRRLDGLRDPGALRPWLLRIQTREAFRVVRRLRRFVPFEPHVHDLSAAARDVDRSLDIERALAHLPRRTRAAIALHYLAGLSVAETAVALGVSENTIKSQVRTGLERLRKELG